MTTTPCADLPLTECNVIGDTVLIVATEAVSAVRTAVDVRAATECARRFATRVGRSGGATWT
jgi:hypothetical protein